MHVGSGGSTRTVSVNGGHFLLWISAGLGQSSWPSLWEEVLWSRLVSNLFLVNNGTSNISDCSAQSCSCGCNNTLSGSVQGTSVKSGHRSGSVQWWTLSLWKWIMHLISVFLPWSLFTDCDCFNAATTNLDTLSVYLYPSESTIIDLPAISAGSDSFSEHSSMSGMDCITKARWRASFLEPPGQWCKSIRSRSRNTAGVVGVPYKLGKWDTLVNFWATAHPPTNNKWC